MKKAITQEKWKFIPGYENFYQASNTGKIRSIDRKTIFSDGHIESICGKELALNVGTTGYYGISLWKNNKEKRYKLHRLVFAAFNGYFPEKVIDHIDGNPLNNNIDNLREVSESCNMHNSKLYSTNTSGIKGVNIERNGNYYRARIVVSGICYQLGIFKKILPAVMARYNAEQKFGVCSERSTARKYLVRKGVISNP